MSNMSDSLFYLVNINSRRKYANKIRTFFTDENSNQPNDNIKIFIKKITKMVLFYYIL